MESRFLSPVRLWSFVIPGSESVTALRIFLRMMSSSSMREMKFLALAALLLIFFSGSLSALMRAPFWPMRGSGTTNVWP